MQPIQDRDGGTEPVVRQVRVAWLALGAALIVLANTRWGVGVLGWVAPVPLLRYLRLGAGWKRRLAIALALPIAWTLAVLKIVTPPLPVVAAFGFGVPIGLLFAAAYLAWDWLRRRADDWRAVLAFPALMVGVEWLQATFTPLGSWGSAAYTQLDDLPLLQVASLFGLAGVGWILYGFASAIDYGLPAGAPPRHRWLAAAGAAVIISHAFGFGRLTLASRPERMVRAAAIGTDATFHGLPLPSPEEVNRTDDALFARTRVAAVAGARLVVWNEGATVVLREQENDFLGRAARAAREGGIELVVSYIVPISTEPLQFENKYVWLRPDGSVDHRYLKHEPVPGEPAVRGTEPARVVDTAFGKASGAICYDYDFPYLGLRHARLGVDIVAVPSSDWRGIDPFHAQMAALRAIEGGFSIVRSTRMGLSAGIDPYGRLRGWLSANESDERLLLVTLPTSSVPTLYARIGDVIIYLGMAYLALLAVLARRRSAPAIGLSTHRRTASLRLDVAAVLPAHIQLPPVDGCVAFRT